MNTPISVCIGGQLSKLTTLLVMGGIGLVVAGCGPQNPSFTEQSIPPATDGKGGVFPSGGADGTASNAGTPDSPTASNSGAAPSGANGVPDSWRPGDIVPGSGANPGVETSGLTLVSDASVQQENSKVDILWVIDSSGSMREEQSYLGQNFSSFINQLSRTNSDFQVGVTTTDVCDSINPSQVPLATRYCPTLDASPQTHLKGSLVGESGKKVLTRNFTDLITRFVNYANVGINGSSFEHGLTAAKMAIAKSISGENEGLVRPEAFLAVIVVSDEEDDGIGLGMTDAYSGYNYAQMGLSSYRYTSDDMIRDALAVKGAGRFSVSTITGTRLANGSMCTSPHSQPLEEGTQYISAARKTGGIIQSICDTNWSASLASIGQDIAAQSSQVVLSRVPFVSSIKVSVNGVVSTNWTYNSGNNAIKFDTGSIPPAGENILIQYYPAP